MPLTFNELSRIWEVITREELQSKNDKLMVFENIFRSYMLSLANDEKDYVFSKHEQKSS